MAIIVRGKTDCPLCKKVINDDDDVTAFPAFVWNQRDPIFIFNDAAFHSQCFHQHHLAAYAQTRHEELLRRVGPGRRECFVCNHQITNPNDYLMIGHLTDEPEHFLNKFNYAQFHISCFSKWDGRELLIEQIKMLDQSGDWEGDSLRLLIKQMRTVRDKS